ncbi:MAG: oppD 6 [Firmicutes bacterium]|nr:oppD 6 [Bacillota bacterium]
MSLLLDVQDLSIAFHTYAGSVLAVNHVSFQLHQGETLGIVGESGCGKSATAQAILGILPQPPSERLNGRIFFQDTELTAFPEEKMRQIRGKQISMIFQDPMTALNPVLTVGLQIAEIFMHHQGLSCQDALQQAESALRSVDIPAPETRLKQYPHQLSGGMRQRVMIAMALACQPQLIIADEPTTALDVTIQAQIIDLLRSKNKQFNTAIILISHDLGVIASLCQRVLVMYAGEIVESSPAIDLYRRPMHPYTYGLLQSVPRPDRKNKQLLSIPGQPPNLLSVAEGCSFGPRCPHAMEICRQKPDLFPVSDQHFTRCWLAHADSPLRQKLLQGEVLGK